MFPIPITPSDEPTPDAPPTAEPAPPPPPARLIVALIPRDGLEPPADLGEAEAEAAWAAASIAWHPALLAAFEALPRTEDAERAASPLPHEVRLVAAGAGGRLPSGYRTHAADAGAVLVDLEPGAAQDRPAAVAGLLGRLGLAAPATLDDPIARDFLALGSACRWLRDTTEAMGHADMLDRENLAREALAGARAWSDGDLATAAGRLRASFELLTQARERFYPVDASIIDICLLDKASPPDSVDDAIEAHSAVTFLAPGDAIEALAAHSPGRIAALRAGIEEGWVDVVGGAYAEVDEPLLPLESILWQFRRGGEAYRAGLDDRNVETLARRRFGLYPQLPQVAKRFGFRFAMPLSFDAGTFPVRVEPKRLWEGADNTNLESLTRPPLAADRAASGARLPWRVAATMKDDHVATLPLIHWGGPSATAGWYADFRRTGRYSPFLARWVTLGDYFNISDRPYEVFRPDLDDYATPYLDQTVARRDPSPIARRASHARLRARFDSAMALHALASSLGGHPEPGPEGMPAAAEVEAAVESGRHEEAAAGIGRIEAEGAQRLARRILGGPGASHGRPGFLVLNPVGVPRRSAVLLPDAAADLAPVGPLKACQLVEDGVMGVVELAAFGFAWVPRDVDPDEAVAAVGDSAHVAGNVASNDAVEVEVDPATGGIRSLRRAGEPSARLGQQLVMTGLSNPDGSPATARMRADSVEVDCGGPALAQVTTRGHLVGPDDLPLAAFRQRLRLWAGRPTFELDVEISDLDAGWLERAATADPWSHNLACRWAWPDAEAPLRRTALLAAMPSTAERMETPDAVDISARRERTAILFGGLAHHRRRGGRMLDTILVAGGEQARHFELGVAVDLEQPFAACQDFVAPPVVIPVDSGPPRPGPSGWLVHLDNPGVAVTSVAAVASTGEGRGPGIVLNLVEVAGRSARCRLRTVRDPGHARQVDFLGDPIADLTLDGDAVLVDLTPHEVARVEVTLG